MAKCSCAGNACSCSVVQGSGITVSGTGSAGSPFVVSVSPTPGEVVLPAPGTLDLGSLGPAGVAKITLQASATGVTLPAAGARLDLLIVQDAVGGRTITWPAAIVFPGGADPVLTVAANGMDWITLISAGGTWAGVKVGSALS